MLLLLLELVQCVMSFVNTIVSDNGLLPDGYSNFNNVPPRANDEIYSSVLDIILNFVRSLYNEICMLNRVRH